MGVSDQLLPPFDLLFHPPPPSPLDHRASMRYGLLQQQCHYPAVVGAAPRRLVQSYVGESTIHVSRAEPRLNIAFPLVCVVISPIILLNLVSASSQCFAYSSACVLPHQQPRDSDGKEGQKGTTTYLLSFPCPDQSTKSNKGQSRDRLKLSC